LKKKPQSIDNYEALTSEVKCPEQKLNPKNFELKTFQRQYKNNHFLFFGCLFLPNYL